MYINQPKSGKQTTVNINLRSGVNWQWVYKKMDVKTRPWHISLHLSVFYTFLTAGQQYNSVPVFILSIRIVI